MPRHAVGAHAKSAAHGDASHDDGLSVIFVAAGQKKEEDKARWQQRMQVVQENDLEG